MTYFVCVYMRRCHAHTKAVIKNGIFLLVYVILFVLYTCIILLWNSGGGGGGGGNPSVPPPPLCMQPCRCKRLIKSIEVN